MKQKLHEHFDTIGWDTVKIILIESFPCDNKMELAKRERHWIEELKPALNDNLATPLNELEKRKLANAQYYKEHKQQKPKEECPECKKLIFCDRIEKHNQEYHKKV